MEMEFKESLPSYYSVLGVNVGSSDEEIRRAYRKLAMVYGDEEIFVFLFCCYESSLILVVKNGDFFFLVAAMAPW